MLAFRVNMIRRLFAMLCLSIAGLPLLVYAQTHSADDSLRMYAVDVFNGSSGSRSGTGVYLGNGLVITAAHVVNHQPSVRTVGRRLPASIIKMGVYEEV